MSIPSPISTTTLPQGPRHKNSDGVFLEKERSGCCCGRKFEKIFPDDARLVKTRPIPNGDF